MPFTLSLEEYQTRRRSEIIDDINESGSWHKDPNTIHAINGIASREYHCFRAYLATAIWADATEDEFTDKEIADESIESMLSEIQNFLVTINNLRLRLPSNYTIENVGHDFWLTRNGHGVGFWDRGLGDLGDELTKHAEACKCSDLYVGDDDLIYCT